MSKDSKPGSTKSQQQTREDRLKAALKANLARRKAQTKARAGEKQPQGKVER